jgi:hypothetical protein
MTTRFVSIIDQTTVTYALRHLLERLRQFQAMLEAEPLVAPSSTDWIEARELLDPVKDDRQPVLRPAPRPLVEVYRRTRTWLREIHPRLHNDPTDRRSRTDLVTLIQNVEQALLEYASC